MSGRFTKRRRFKAQWTPDSEGVKHPSKGEAHWFDRLLLRQRAGEISKLERRPTYIIKIARDCPNCEANGEKLCVVELDAAYLDGEGARHVVDYKGREGNTPLSKLKRLMVRLRFGVDVELAGPALVEENKKKEKAALKEHAQRRKRGQLNMLV